jgi:DNA replication protein DnaC
VSIGSPRSIAISAKDAFNLCMTSTMVTSNLPFQEWTEILGSERLTEALLDRLTHHVHILEMNGDSYRLKQSKHKRGSANP